MSGMFDKIVEVLPSLPNELPRIIKQEKSRDDSETDKVVEDADQIELVTEFDEEPVIVHLSYMCLDMTKPYFIACKQQRGRSACTSTQSNQCLCFSLFTMDTT